MASVASCIFCKIIKGDIPCFKLYESARVLAFLDIQPLSRGHTLIIPKTHGEKLVDVPDEELSELLPVAKRIVTASGAKDYNILQNNGTIAHQIVNHVHIHIIPKPDEDKGLGVSWPAQDTDMDALKVVFEDMKAKM